MEVQSKQFYLWTNIALMQINICAVPLHNLSQNVMKLF